MSVPTRKPEVDATDNGGILACPSCLADGLRRMDVKFECGACHAEYPVVGGVLVLLTSGATILDAEKERPEFWNAGWESKNAEFLKLDADGVRAERQVFLEAMERQKYPSVAEIGPETVAGKTFLNIGCGGGHEGLLFSGYGADYIGVDFSYNAARYTQELIVKAGYRGVAYQAEAEHLPFKGDSIEFIYSNGVLHHTPNTLETLKEAHRVLAPGGTAMIGLYATQSITFYWYRLHAILRGNLTRKSIERWLDANSEGEWRTEGRVNLYTRTYTKRQFAGLLKEAGFDRFRIRVTPAQLKDIPIVGNLAGMILPAFPEMRIGPFGMILMATCIKGQA